MPWAIPDLTDARASRLNPGRAISLLRLWLYSNEAKAAQRRFSAWPDLDQLAALARVATPDRTPVMRISK
jgi:hypothetical protein